MVSTRSQCQGGSAWRNFYVWSDTPDKYKEARIIFKDFEVSNWSWDPVAKAYYWHRFYSHQPDLNFDSPLVRKEVLRALDFWFEMGVDGLRLDAIPYLFEREGTTCENLDVTHAFIKKLRKHVDANFQDRMLIAEANQWPEDAAAYFGNDDECHMVFNFPIMPRLFMAMEMEDRFPIIDILEQTPTPSPLSQWALFIRNHDELTLEMVTAEERDYMYRIYARDPNARINLGIRRRLATLLNNDRAKIELMYILLLSLPGTPVMYYGDEIGMGDNYYLGDRNGVRTPMQWSPDRNAGFSTANPQKLYLPLIIDPSYHYEVVNVENQERNMSSLLWWVRRMILVYKNHLAFGLGSFEEVISDNSKILAFTRTYQDETILVVINLSRFHQATELDLSKYAGFVPYELIHQNRFPDIKDKAYNFTLGPYDYFWLSLVPTQGHIHLQEEKEIILQLDKSWEEVFDGKHKEKLEKELLPRFIKNAKWFERINYTIQNARIVDSISFSNSRLCLIELEYLDTEIVDTYFVAISFAKKSEGERILFDTPQAIIVNVKVSNQEGFLYDSIYSEVFRNDIFKLIIKRKKGRSDVHEIISHPGELLSKDFLNTLQLPLPSQVIKVDQKKLLHYIWTKLHSKVI